MLYAAYGSNLHPARLAARLPECRFLGTGEILDRNLCFHKRSIDGSAKCNIVTGYGRVHVSVYDIGRHGKVLLGRIEGPGYSETTIEVPGFGDCLTYVASVSYVDSSIRPYSWYKELVLVGCEVLGFPDHYVAMIRDITAVEDADEKRHASNMRIVAKARDHAYVDFFQGGAVTDHGA